MCNIELDRHPPKVQHYTVIFGAGIQLHGFSIGNSRYERTVANELSESKRVGSADAALSSGTSVFCRWVQIHQKRIDPLCLGHTNFRRSFDFDISLGRLFRDDVGRRCIEVKTENCTFSWVDTNASWMSMAHGSFRMLKTWPVVDSQYDRKAKICINI